MRPGVITVDNSLTFAHNGNGQHLGVNKKKSSSTFYGLDKVSPGAALLTPGSLNIKIQSSNHDVQTAAPAELQASNLLSLNTKNQN